jgi:hypothetical protein
MRGSFTHTEARASLIVFFFATSVFSAVATLYAGLLRWEGVLVSLGAFPVIALSSWGGGRLFARYGASSYRRVGVLCLTAAAIVAFVKAFLSA